MMGGKRILAGFLAVCLLLAMLPAAALAEEPTPTELDLSKGNITLSETSVSGFDRDGNQVSEVNPDGYRIVQSNPDVSTGNGVTIGAGQVSVTLAGVNIARGGDAIALNADARATVVLEQGTENYAISSKNAGVYVDAKASLELSGAGNLTAQGGTNGAGAAGIGGAYESSTDNPRGNFGSILLCGTGTIAATGGDRAAGIGGGGKVSNTGSITGRIEIVSGTVRATGGQYAAGIGWGADGGSNEESLILIRGGRVEATGGDGSAGIGCGWNGKCGVIAITGGSVTAKTPRPDLAVDIGGGYQASGGLILLTGADVAASSVGGGFMARDWSGFDLSHSDEATLRGDRVTIPFDLELPAGKKLTIGSGQTLALAEGATFTNSGTLVIGGTLDAGAGRLLGNPPYYQPAVELRAEGLRDNCASSLALAGDTLKLTALVTVPEGAPAPQGTVRFLINGEQELGQAELENGQASISITMDAGWADFRRECGLTAVYSGDSGQLQTADSYTESIYLLESDAVLYSELTAEEYAGDGQKVDLDAARLVWTRDGFMTGAHGALYQVTLQGGQTAVFDLESDGYAHAEVSLLKPELTGNYMTDLIRSYNVSGLIAYTPEQTTQAHLLVTGQGGDFTLRRYEPAETLDFTKEDAPEEGEGFRWDAGQSLLTLDGFDRVFLADRDPYAGILLPDGATVALAAGSENVIRCLNGCALLSHGALAIEGPGTLRISGQDDGRSSIGINVDGSLTIHHAQITLQNMRSGLYAGDLTISDSTVTAENCDYSFTVESGARLSGSSLDVGTIELNGRLEADNCFLRAEKIQCSAPEVTDSLVFGAGFGTVIGSYTLPRDLTIDWDECLYLPEGTVLTAGEGTALTLEGWLVEDAGGSRGTLAGDVRGQERWLSRCDGAVRLSVEKDTAGDGYTWTAAERLLKLTGGWCYMGDFSLPEGSTLEAEGQSVVFGTDYAALEFQGDGALRGNGGLLARGVYCGVNVSGNLIFSGSMELQASGGDDGIYVTQTLTLRDRAALTARGRRGYGLCLAERLIREDRASLRAESPSIAVIAWGGSGEDLDSDEIFVLGRANLHGAAAGEYKDLYDSRFYTFFPAGEQQDAYGANACKSVNITARAEDDWEETGAAHGRIAVTISASRGGTVSPMFDSLPYLGSRTLIFTPDDGFRVADVRVDGTSIGAVESYAIQNATADVTVEVVFAPVGGAAETFTDVPQDAWYREAVDYVTGTGLFQGTSDRAFSPDGRMTRAMLAAVLYRAAGEPSIEDEIWGYPFADVEAGSWYGTAVYWARLKGILSGYSDEFFGPDDPVTREQLAAMLYRYAGEPDASGELTRFPDADRVSPWAADALKWAVGEGIVSGRDEGVLDPKGFATRAEVSAMLLRYLNGNPAQN